MHLVFISPKKHPFVSIFHSKKYPYNKFKDHQRQPPGPNLTSVANFENSLK